MLQWRHQSYPKLQVLDPSSLSSSSSSSLACGDLTLKNPGVVRRSPSNIEWDKFLTIFHEFFVQTFLSPYLSELDFSNSPVSNIQFGTNWIFFQVQTDFFSSFMARVKYFDGPCLTIYSLSTIYRYIPVIPVSGLVDSLQPLL